MDTQTSQATVVGCGEDLLERMVAAAEKVRERLARSAAALESAGLPYAVIGGNAVAAWVSKVDPGAVRNTVDVDLLVNRTDFDAVKSVLTAAGFVHHELMGVHMFLDGPEGRPRDAIHLFLAGEKVRHEYHAPAPRLITNKQHDAFKLLELEPLVTMKLTSFRLKDRVHLLDMIEVGLLDASWCERLQPEFAERLRELLDNPDGGSGLLPNNNQLMPRLRRTENSDIADRLGGRATATPDPAWHQSSLDAARKTGPTWAAQN